MLRDLLQRKRKEILDRWFSLILETYPPDTAKMLKAEKDRFVNPVGATLSEEIGALFDQFVDGMKGGTNREMDWDRITSSLEKVLQIRSVQDFSPSQAVCVVHLIKEAIRRELEPGLLRDVVFDEWLEIESSIDRVSLLAFDVYTRCREKMYDIRLRELKAQKERAFELMARAARTK